LAQSASTSSTQTLISQAVAEIHLGRLDEAEAALQQALAKEPKNAEAIANIIVLNAIAGKDVKQLKSYAVHSIFEEYFMLISHIVTCKALHPIMSSSPTSKKKPPYSTKQPQNTLPKSELDTL
jgi:hypothetical protein